MSKTKVFIPIILCLLCVLVIGFLVFRPKAKEPIKTYKTAVANEKQGKIDSIVTETKSLHMKQDSQESEHVHSDTSDSDINTGDSETIHSIEDVPTALSNGTGILAPIADTKSIEAEKQSRLFLEKRDKYLQNFAEWVYKRDKAHTDWMLKGEVLDNLFPRDPKEFATYVSKMSSEEKKQHIEKLNTLFLEYKSTSEKLDSVMNEEPIAPVLIEPN